MSVVGKYAEFAVSCRTKDHSKDVFHHTKRALIDWFACTLPGGLEEPAVLMTRALDEDIGRGKSTLLPRGEPATTRTAALINGTASHIIEMMLRFKIMLLIWAIFCRTGDKCCF